jgi:hypothetical protein
LEFRKNVYFTHRKMSIPSALTTAGYLSLASDTSDFVTNPMTQDLNANGKDINNVDSLDVKTVSSGTDPLAVTGAGITLTSTGSAGITLASGNDVSVNAVGSLIVDAVSTSIIGTADVSNTITLGDTTSSDLVIQINCYNGTTPDGMWKIYVPHAGSAGLNQGHLMIYKDNTPIVDMAPTGACAFASNVTANAITTLGGATFTGPTVIDDLTVNGNLTSAGVGHTSLKATTITDLTVTGTVSMAGKNFTSFGTGAPQAAGSGVNYYTMGTTAAMPASGVYLFQVNIEVDATSLDPALDKACVTLDQVGGGVSSCFFTLPMGPPASVGTTQTDVTAILSGYCTAGQQYALNIRTDFTSPGAACTFQYTASSYVPF